MINIKHIVSAVPKYFLSEEQKMSLEKDWASIEGFALEKKRQRFFEVWIEDQKNKTYVKTNSSYKL